MHKAIKHYITAAILVVTCLLTGLLLFFREPGIRINDILAVYEKTSKNSELAITDSLFFFHEPIVWLKDIMIADEKVPKDSKLTITYPLDSTFFPPEIISPIFRWKDDHSKTDVWLITIRFHDNQGVLIFTTYTKKWRPSDKQWSMIKNRSLEKEARVSVIGINHTSPEIFLSSDSIVISTSKDEVGDSIFYREVPLPFIDAVEDPSYIQWRFGAISSKTQPPIIMDDLPVCGNCHSFSADGSILAMDVDYANDKGSYVIAPVEEEIILDKSKIITWSDYKKDDGVTTFGLLSQISPSGKYVVSTVKDRSVFVATEGILFSQLFFPIKGILVVYNRETKTFQELSGADDPEFVQSNPSWSPDGKQIVFARSKVHHLKHLQEKDKNIVILTEDKKTVIANKKTILLTEEEAREFLKERKTFLYDLYRIPFNDGKGGQAEPIKGASHNGMSNYFAKYSPDGKWIVFCKAKSFMLLQPDSELYIIPAKGGKARRMRCNTPRMNSWHSWSSNSRWLVFSSKANSAYTQLFLTHIDEQGNDTPPVLLEHFTSEDMAGNIPEFVNLKPNAIKVIREKFLDDISFIRAAREFREGDDYNSEMKALRKALEINPQNVIAHEELGFALLKVGKLEEAIVCYTEALRLNPKSWKAHCNLGSIMFRQNTLKEAAKHCKEALRLNPNYVVAHINLGMILSKQGKSQEAVIHYNEALRLKPENVITHNNLGSILFTQGKLEEAIVHYNEVLRLDPENRKVHNNLGSILFTQGKLKEAVEHYKEALRLNPNYVKAHKNFAVVLEKLGKFKEADFHHTEAIRLDSTRKKNVR